MCDIAQAERHVGELIAKGVEPVVLASLVDLATARVLQSIAADGRIRLFTEQSKSESAIRTSMVRDGMISGTLGDVRRHADLVWIVGDIAATAPRFIDEVIRPGSGPSVHQFAAGATVDEIVAFSVAVETDGQQRSSGRMSGLLDAVYATVNSDPDSGRSDNPFAVRYLAVVIADNAFDDDAALAVAAILNRAIMKLNEKIRAVVIALDSAATLRSVSAWSQNRSLPVWDSDATAAPLGTAMIRIGNPRPAAADNENADNENADNGSTNLVAVQIGGVDPGPESAICYLPASIPGVDRDGFVVRGDGSVSLPLMAAGQQPGDQSMLASAGELLISLLS